MTIVNPIQKVILTKVNTLLEKQKLAESIEHTTTKGDLRENYLKEFIEDIIPDEYDTTTGFISSYNQAKLSPQVDLIINEKVRTPKFLLSESKSIIPFESTFLLIEVKTRITNKVIEQIEKQNEFIQRCGNPNFYRTHLLTDLNTIQAKHENQFISINNTFDKPLPFIAAFTSDLSEEILISLFSKIKLLGIWVIGKYFLYTNDGTTLVKKEGEESTLYAVDSILNNITIMNMQRHNYRTNWTKYFIT